jgi:hypothetical protein
MDEDKEEDTDKIVYDMAAAMKVELKSTDISRGHRIPTRKKRKKKRDIVVRFISYNNRKKFLDSKRKLADNNQHLTAQRKELFW